MQGPTGTIHPATMSMPSGYAPVNAKKAKSRVPGRGTSFQGDHLYFQPMSQQAHGRPGLDTGSEFTKVAPDAKGPASRP